MFDASPVEHWPKAGGELSSCPLAEPQEASTIFGASHKTLVDPLLQLQCHEPSPYTALDVPFLHNPATGANFAGSPDEKPQETLAVGCRDDTASGVDFAVCGARKCICSATDDGSGDALELVAVTGVSGAGCGRGEAIAGADALDASSSFNDNVLQVELVPSLSVHDHVHGPSPLMTLAVPARHRSFSGAS